MFEEYPFTAAQESITQGCAWLAELLLPEGHPERECPSNAESWEQARAFLMRAVATLDERGREHVEDGGQHSPDNGWLPAFRTDVIDADAAAAADAIREALGPLLRVPSLIVPDNAYLEQRRIETIVSLLESRYPKRLQAEREASANQPDPESA
jgi:hypothetical protein